MKVGHYLFHGMMNRILCVQCKLKRVYWHTDPNLFLNRGMLNSQILNNATEFFLPAILMRLRNCRYVLAVILHDFIHNVSCFRECFKMESQSNYSNYIFTIRYLHSMPLAYYITYYYSTFIPGVLQCFLFW